MFKSNGSGGAVAFCLCYNTGKLLFVVQQSHIILLSGEENDRFIYSTVRCYGCGFFWVEVETNIAKMKGLLLVLKQIAL